MSITNTRTELWRSRLGSALRTTLACTIAGCTSLYSPAPLRRYLEFPSFTYSTTLLLVSDATLGDTLRGCCHVLCASIYVMIFSVLSLHVIGPHNFTNGVAALAMAAGAFGVALPESTHLVTKQIAFGMLVNVYVSAVIDGGKTGVFMHPINVVCSTALGAVASVLATFIPYPRLAYEETRKFYRLYAENIFERLNCNIEAISARDNSAAVGFLTQSKFLSTTGTNLLQTMRSKLDGMQWERSQTRIFNLHWIDLEENLQDKEIPIRGMGIALSSCTSFPVGVIDEELRRVLHNCRGQLGQKLDQQANCFAPFDATTTLDMKKEILTKNLSIADKDLPTSFFLYCVNLLLGGMPIAKKTDHMLGKAQKSGDSQWNSRKIREVMMNLIPSNHNLAFAFKSSLALGLAVLFGLTYNKENGYWSGLLIALCFVTGRHPTFSLANARAQGTAMGSIYGILCCFILRRFVDLMFLPLLPWIVFSSFLGYSRMYGKAGAVSAVTGALLVVGMKHNEATSEFALARIVEATIGLICFLIVEILFNPFRAATLAKYELSQSLRELKHCIDQIADITLRERDMPSSSYQALREGQKKLKSRVCQLEEFIAEAELEPNFWFIPFHCACYSKMQESLSRMVDLLLLVAYSMEDITRLSQKDGAFWVDLQDRVNENVRIFKNKVGPTLKCLEEITRIKSLRKLENELKERNLPNDIESQQEHPKTDTFRILGGDEEVHNITGSFLQHLEEMANKIHTTKDDEEMANKTHTNKDDEEVANKTHTNKDEEEMAKKTDTNKDEAEMASKIHTNRDEEMHKGQVLFHYSCLGFCISGLMRETLKIQREIKELLMWENPSSETNLKEIYCKINALCSQ